MLDRAEGPRVSIGWLVEQLGRRSFGLTLLVMAVVGFVPGASTVVGLLMAWPPIQMVLGHETAVLPRLVARREIEVGRLAPIIGIVAPWLAWLERLIRPRWTPPFHTTKRLTGIVMLLLGPVDGRAGAVQPRHAGAGHHAAGAGLSRGGRGGAADRARPRRWCRSASPASRYGAPWRRSTGLIRRAQDRLGATRRVGQQTLEAGGIDLTACGTAPRRPDRPAGRAAWSCGGKSLEGTPAIWLSPSFQPVGAAGCRRDVVAWRAGAGDALVSTVRVACAASVPDRRETTRASAALRGRIKLAGRR